MVILNSPCSHPPSFTHFLSCLLSPGISLLLPAAELREDLWAEKEAERRQVGGTAGSQSQQLCQNLAFFPGSWVLGPGSWVRLSVTRPAELKAPEQSSRNTKATLKREETCARVCERELFLKPPHTTCLT